MLTPINQSVAVLEISWIIALRWMLNHSETELLDDFQRRNVGRTSSSAETHEFA